jgi:hypothetical protein
MGFCTRNSDGASGKAESIDTISAKDMASLRDRGIKHQVANEGGMFGDKARRYARAHDQSKTGTN